MDTEPYHSTLPPPTHQTFHPTAPWLNSRTRKRVRDNRPSESQIHHDTVRRLFTAQQQCVIPMTTAADRDMMMILDDDSAPSFTEPYILPSPSAEPMLEDEEDYCHNAAPIGVPEANQRSIHDFFARQKGKEREDRDAHHPRPLTAPTPALAVPIITTEAEPQLLLRERRSFGVLSGMNHTNMGGAAGDMFSNAATMGALGAAAAATSAAAVSAGSCLPIDFKPAEVVVALMEDAMVMG
jgi:hypothetical protein